MINYTANGIIITDEIGNRPPITLPLGSTNAEIEAAAAPYHPQQLPEPQWEEFREGLRTENGYQSYFAQAAQQQPITASSLPVYFVQFRQSGDYTDFLKMLSDLISLLPPEDTANALSELMQLSQRCAMPPAFIAALGALAGGGQ